jgi:hypothetical protein
METIAVDGGWPAWLLHAELEHTRLPKAALQSFFLSPVLKEI